MDCDEPCGQEAAAERFKDALADELHERDAEIPEGTPPNAIEALDEECRHAAEDIRDYLETLEQLRHLQAVFEAVGNASGSAGGQNTAEGQSLYRELERLDNCIQEVNRGKGALEAGAQATLERLVILKMARRKVESEQGSNRTGPAST